MKMDDSVYFSKKLYTTAPTFKEVTEFVIESNHIEGICIKRPDKFGAVWYETLTEEEQNNQVELLIHFINLKELRLDDIKSFVDNNQPDNMFKPKLRDTVGMDVRVGSYTAPEGGPDIRQHMEDILKIANEGAEHPYEVHHRYETLHPFQDGNGRSGRAIWAWMMNRKETHFWKRGFLHSWYYQTLEFSNKR